MVMLRVDESSNALDIGGETNAPDLWGEWKNNYRGI